MKRTTLATGLTRWRWRRFGTRPIRRPSSQRACTPRSPRRRREPSTICSGKKQVPADAYYGVQTARALENFQISGVTMNHYPEFVEAYAIVKLAAARANTNVGKMKQDRLDGDREGRRRR